MDGRWWEGRRETGEGRKGGRKEQGRSGGQGEMDGRWWKGRREPGKRRKGGGEEGRNKTGVEGREKWMEDVGREREGGKERGREGGRKGGRQRAGVEGRERWMEESGREEESSTHLQSPGNNSVSPFSLICFWSKQYTTTSTTWNRKTATMLNLVEIFQPYLI